MLFPQCTEAKRRQSYFTIKNVCVKQWTTEKKEKQFWIKGLSTNEKTNSVRAHERRYVFPTKGNLNFKHENLDWTSSESFTLDTSPFQRDLVNNILK